MRSDKRLQRNTSSVLALVDLLSEVTKEPVFFVSDTALVKSLVSQGGLAKYEDAERGIYASSLNTIKRISENVVVGGFSKLDALRIAAFTSISQELQRKQKSNKNTKVGLTKKVSELEQELKMVRQDLLLVTFGLEKALSRLQYYALHAGDPALNALCQKEQRELLDMMSLRNCRYSKTSEDY